MKISSKKARFFFSLQILLIICSLSLAQSSISPHGINAHVPNSYDLQKIEEAGIEWIRVDFNWYQIETENDQYNWQVYDDMVIEARQKGLSILAILFGTPSWSSGGVGINFPPSREEDWVDFVKEAVARYKNNIKYWAMWNEPNLDEFWKGTVSEYINTILVSGAEAAKSIDSLCKIVGPGLSHLEAEESKWNIWLRAILRNGGKDQLDIISHHIYDIDGPSHIFDKLENDQGPLVPSVQRVLQEEEVDAKPFWITETGWNTDEVGEEVQSLFYLEFLQGMRERSYIKKIFFYEIIDDPRPDIPHYGIIYSNYTPKKAYYTYKDFIAGKYPPEEQPPLEDDDNQCPLITSAKEEENAQEKISILKHARDSILKTTIKGSKLVKFYYKLAPEINSILLINPYARRLSSDCLTPVVSFMEEINAKGKENIEEKFLSDEEIRKIKDFIRVLKYYASPELGKKLSITEKMISRYKHKSLNSLILDLDFDLIPFEEEKRIDK
ncbi:MAG: glycosyl hydrolase [Candidatus Aminicenantaceae bacterium]